jgi:hypothetical protein
MTKRKRQRTKPKVFAQRVEYLDPLHCASRVGYHIGLSKSGYISGEINLTECSREITWRLDHSIGYDPVMKIQKAIDILIDCRNEWIKAAKTRRKR